MTVRDVIEALEELPSDCPVVVGDAEVTEILLRDEVYYTEDLKYGEGLIVKIY